MNNLGYKQEDVEALWDLMKDSGRIGWSQPPGIRAVNFNGSVKYFTDNHRTEAEKIWKNIETIVTTDLTEAIRVLSNARIAYHRLS